MESPCENGLDVLHLWLEIAKQAFITRAQESTDPSVIGSSVISRDAITEFQTNCLPIIREALDLLDTHHDLNLVKVRNGDLSADVEEVGRWEEQQRFCQYMLRGTDPKPTSPKSGDVEQMMLNLDIVHT